MKNKLNFSRVKTQDGLSTSFLMLLRMASWLGYLPVSLKKTKSQRITFRLSRRLKWINGFAIIFLACGRTFSFFDDIIVGTIPASMVTIMLRVLELAAMGIYMAGVQLTSNRRVTYLQKFVRVIKRIDSSLGDSSVYEKEQFRVRYLIITISLIFPLVFWDFWRQTLNVDDTSSETLDTRQIRVFRNFSPYFVAVITLVLYQATASFFYYMVDIRMVKLYGIAKLLYKEVCEDQQSIAIDTIDDIMGSRRANKNTDYLSYMRNSASFSQDLMDKVKQVTKLQSEIRDLCAELNKCYDGLVVIFLCLTLLQLNISLFFLIVDSSMSNSAQTISLQVVWVIMHMHWIMLHVEACSRISKKDRELSSLLGDVLAELSMAGGGGWLRKRELRALWRANELAALAPLLFEPLDLTAVDRSLYSTIARTITTYLVILIQLHKSYS